MLFFNYGIKVLMDGTNFSTPFVSWDCSVYVPRTYENRVQGLMGYFDGISGNEFHTRQNEILSNVTTDREIYYHLDETCESYQLLFFILSGASLSKVVFSILASWRSL